MYNCFDTLVKDDVMNYILDFLRQFISDNLLLLIFGILTSYQYIYLLIGVFSKKKTYENTNIEKKYAIMIAARNEELVIGKLLDSLNKQNYSKDKITIFVVADNCKDNTYSIAKKHGAIVYERFNEKEQRKGYALNFLMNKINEDYGISSFDGFLVFDADNLVDKNFIKEINKAFVKKGGIVTGYRNIKNFDTNLVSSAYGIHFYKTVVSYHRPREALNLGTHIAGTGFVIDSKLLKDGWNFTSLTEDTELTLHFANKGIKVSFCEDAMFYDEQPVDFKTAYRQRKRWTKGRLDVFIKHFFSMIVNFFKRLSFTIYDMFFYSFPWPFYSLIKFILYPIIAGIIFKDIYSYSFWTDFSIAFLLMMVGIYVNNFIFGLLVVIRERKYIETSLFKKIIAVITYPWFNMMTIFIALGILFNPFVSWKEIKHQDTRKIDDVKYNKK